MNLAALLVTAALVAAPAPKAVLEKERGDRLLENGDLPGAREAYDNALALAPGWAEALNQIGFLLIKQEKREEAVEHFKKANRADPRFALAYYNLGATLRKLGRYPEAVEAYRTYLGLEPSDASAVFGLAEAHRAAGDKANALAAYERYLAADREPANQKRIDKAQATAAQLRKELGVVAARSPVATPPAASEPQAPSAPLAKAPPAPAAPAPTAPVSTADIRPTSPSVASPPPAAARGEPAAPADGADAGAVSAERIAYAARRFDEAMQQRSHGQHRESLFALQDAVNADPTNVRVVFELASAYAILGNFPQAIAFWQRVLSMPTAESNRVAAEQNIERAKQKMAQAAPAAAPATAAVAPASTATAATEPASAASSAPAPSAERARPLPFTPEAQDAYAKGLHAYSAARYADALHEFDRAIGAKADFAQAYSGRGSTYLALGDHNRALADYAQAMRLDSTMAYPVFGVAEALTLLGRKADALRYYQAYAASRAPDVQPALLERARKRIAEIGP
jgi:tetratricopeptide (TPR) repeat protein